MEVLNNNFAQLLPQVLEDIRNSDFVAIDLELTGLSTGDREVKIASYDNVQHRYTKLVEGAGDFVPNQFGLCTFKWDAEKSLYIAKPYNFFIFPRKFGNIDRRFTSQASSLEFLLSHNFDFNKWISQGISYLSIQQEEEARKDLSKVQQDREDVILTKDDKEFIAGIIQKVEEWLKSDTAATTPLPLPPCSSYHRRLTYQEVGRKFPHLSLRSTQDTNTASRYIEVSLMTEEQKAEKEKQRRAEAEAALNEAIGFRKVIDAIINNKKPMLGHNMFLDLLHLYQNFIGNLPESSDEYIKTLHNYFPLYALLDKSYSRILIQASFRIGDTKHMAVSASQLSTMKGLNTSLGELYKAIENKLPAPIQMAEGFTRYSSEQAQLHEAGYDAYLTGAVFLGLAGALLEDNASLPILPSDDRLYLWMNKLHLMRVRGYMCMEGKHFLPARRRMYFVSGFSEDTKQSHLTKFFEPLASRISCSWIDETSAVVEFPDDIDEHVVLEHTKRQNSALNTSLFVSSIEHFDKIVEAQRTEVVAFRTKKRKFSELTPDSTPVTSPVRTPASATESGKKRRKKDVPKFPDVPFKDLCSTM